MIVPNIEIIALLVALFFGIPILWNSKKNRLFKKFNFIKLIKTINKSLITQGVIALILITLTWSLNSVELKFESLIIGTTYTYLIIGIFMYLPALGILNFIKYIADKKLEKSKTE